MTGITAILRAHRRSVAVAITLVALVLAAGTIAVLAMKTSPAHGMHHLGNRHHHLSHLLQVLLDARRLES